LNLSTEINDPIDKNHGDIKNNPDNIVKTIDDDNNSNDNDDDTSLNRKVFIRNIEWNVHENLLNKFLQKFGQIKKSKIIRDSKTNRSKGYGRVEFVNEAGATKLLQATGELKLIDRVLIIDKYHNKKKKSKTSPSSSSNNNKYNKNNNKMKSENNDELNTTEKSELNTSNTNNSSLSIQSLPVNVMVIIFSDLCLRDLCIVEQVCRHWYNIAFNVWSTKKQLILDEKHIYNGYRSKKSIYGFNTNKSKKKLTVYF
jgi:RNA recognition motif-containing protein